MRMEWKKSLEFEICSKIIVNEKFYQSKTITRLMLKNVIKCEKSLEA